jgi:hypothetical protein
MIRYPRFHSAKTAHHHSFKYEHKQKHPTIVVRDVDQIAEVATNHLSAR